MATKSDEDIVKEESGLESKITDEEVLAHLSFGNDEKPQEENLKPVNEDSQAQNGEKLNENDPQNVIENEDKDNEHKIDQKDLDEDFSIQKKQPKIFKILIAIAASLFVILILGLILYFSGFFDSEEPKVQKIEKVEVKKAVPEIVFNEKDIDKNELNKKLTMLTKKEIMNKDELEAEEKKIQEEKKKKEEEQKKALEEKKKQEELKLANQLAKIQEEKNQLEKQQEEIKKQQEEFLKLQENAKKELEEKIKNLEGTEQKNKEVNFSQIKQTIPTNNNIQEEQPTTIQTEQQSASEDITMANKSFLSFINVATIKGDLHKSFLDKVQKYDKNISLCRDLKNRIEIYFGPYDSQVEREKVYNALIENGFKEAYLVDFTKEEYEKRCKY